MGLTEVMEILTAFLTNIISDFYKIIEMLSKSLSPLSVIIHNSSKICVGCRSPSPTREKPIQWHVKLQFT